MFSFLIGLNYALPQSCLCESMLNLLGFNNKSKQDEHALIQSRSFSLFFIIALTVDMTKFGQVGLGLLFHYFCVQHFGLAGVQSTL